MTYLALCRNTGIYLVEGEGAGPGTPRSKSVGELLDVAARRWPGRLAAGSAVDGGVVKQFECPAIPLP
jgi:hypothetical protein